jgi:hypothetical protein
MAYEHADRRRKGAAVKHAIDHLVLCVNDLDRARRFYESVGFRVTPRAQHPFGTANHLALLQDGFLELLAVADRGKLPTVQPGEFNFADFGARFLRRRQGLSMLVFPSNDARQDQRSFAARGLDTYAPLDFSGGATLPDGSEVTVSFSLAFVTHADMPDAAFFVCQHHTPQYLRPDWTPEYQRHPNGATAVVEVLMAAEAPGPLADFFGRLVDPRVVTHDGNGLRIALDGSAITIFDPALLKARCPTADAFGVDRGPCFVGFGVAVEDLREAEAILRRNEIPFRQVGDRLQVSGRDAFGTIIEFSAVGSSP